jgi:hypothetical protein
VVTELIGEPRQAHGFVGDDVGVVSVRPLARMGDCRNRIPASRRRAQLDPDVTRTDHGTERDTSRVSRLAAQHVDEVARIFDQRRVGLGHAIRSWPRVRHIRLGAGQTELRAAKMAERTERGICGLEQRRIERGAIILVGEHDHAERRFGSAEAEVVRVRERGAHCGERLLESTAVTSDGEELLQVARIGREAMHE